MDQGNIALYVALFTLAGTTIGAVFVFFGKKDDNSVARGNSVDAQEAQIRAELRADIEKYREREEAREALVRELSRKNEALESRNEILEKQVVDYREERLKLQAQIHSLEDRVTRMQARITELVLDGGRPAPQGGEPTKGL